MGRPVCEMSSRKRQFCPQRGGPVIDLSPIIAATPREGRFVVIGSYPWLKRGQPRRIFLLRMIGSASAVQLRA
jgi:hypothetical protein